MAACEIAWLYKLLHDLGHDVPREITLYCDNMRNLQLTNNPVLHDLGYNEPKEVTLYCDNVSNIQLANNSIFHARTKHIECTIIMCMRRSL